METDPQTKRENRIKQNNHSFEGQKSESLTESLYCQQSSHFHNVRLACSRCVRYPIIHCCIIFAILECSESSSCIAFRNIKLQYAVQQILQSTPLVRQQNMAICCSFYVEGCTAASRKSTHNDGQGSVNRIVPERILWLAMLSTFCRKVSVKCTRVALCLTPYTISLILLCDQDI